MNIRQARNKIKSVTNVRKITKAMQLVSGIKMRKAQQVAVDGRPYEQYLTEIIRKIVGNIDPQYSRLLITNPEAKNKELSIVVASNKGLCGTFNMNLIKFILQHAEVKKTDFLIIGKKAAEISKYGGSVIADYSSNAPLENVSAVFTQAVTHFLDGSYNSVSLYYNRFISTLKNEPTKEILMPVTLELTTAAKKEPKLSSKETEYLIEPDPGQIIDPLLHSYLEHQIYNAIIQTEAGEHSSRMIAMKNATDNANDVIYNLTLLRNKLRQEKITNELLDMVTAKESVETN